jgi:hypothetical protein
MKQWGRNRLPTNRADEARALHQAEIARAENDPAVYAMQWHLGGGHEEIDICDDVASLDLFGLGPGVYPKDSVPDLQHPNCMCYLTVLHDRQRVWTGEPNPKLLPTKNTEILGNRAIIQRVIEMRFAKRMAIYQAQAEAEGRSLSSILRPPEGQVVFNAPAEFPKKGEPR